MDEKKKMERLIFACGGEIKAVAGQIKPGGKLLVSILADKSLSRPMIGETACNCLCGCPCTKKESGREQARGWFTKSEEEPLTDNKLTWAVRCRVIEIEPVLN